MKSHHVEHFEGCIVFVPKNRAALEYSVHVFIFGKLTLALPVKMVHDCIIRMIVEPAGGMIFAWGATDIDARDSHLHTRHEIGIHSTGNYHSVNTGKYTMCPYLGYQTADRLLGISG